VRRECCSALTPTLSLAGEGVAIAFIDRLARERAQGEGDEVIRLYWRAW
jgi:hypothetical protein